LDPQESEPNGISIGSAVFAQLTRVPNTHTHTHTYTDETRCVHATRPENNQSQLLQTDPRDALRYAHTKEEAQELATDDCHQCYTKRPPKMTTILQRSKCSNCEFFLSPKFGKRSRRK